MVGDRAVRLARRFGATSAKKPENRYASYDEPLRAINLAKLLKLPAAGLFQRGMAWFLDTAILDAYGAFFTAAEKSFLTQSAWETRLSSLQFLQSLLSVGVALAVPIFVILLYCKRETTPGENCSNCESSIRTTNPLFRPALPCKP